MPETEKIYNEEAAKNDYYLSLSRYVAPKKRGRGASDGGSFGEIEGGEEDKREL